MGLGVPLLCWPPALSLFKSLASLEMSESLEEFDIGAGLLLGNNLFQTRLVADAGLRLHHWDKEKIECQTLVINIIAINKSIKTRL